MTFENRKFVIFDVSETGSIDFTEVLESDTFSLRLNESGSRTFVKYDSDMPTSVSNLTTKTQEYTYTEMQVILDSLEWASPLPDDEEV